jgi:O-acetyl-ADP-ribose deacetylase
LGGAALLAPRSDSLLRNRRLERSTSGDSAESNIRRHHQIEGRCNRQCRSKFVNTWWWRRRRDPPNRGPELQAECLNLNGCQTGDAKATKAWGLPAKYVIHTVGPVWRARHLDGTEEDLLASCYRRSLEVADALAVKSIAFPAISTGIYGFPKELAAKIAVAEATSFSGGVESMFFVCFDEETHSIYKRLLPTKPKDYLPGASQELTGSRGSRGPKKKSRANPPT